MTKPTFEVEATLSGIHSRSEETVKISRDFDRQRATEDQLDDAFRVDAQNLVSLQRQAGFNLVTDGQLKWQDFLRPFSDNVGGLREGADLSRWFDTNTFFRRPSVVGKIKLKKGSEFLSKYEVEEALDLAEGGGLRKKITVPGPFTLASLAQDEHYNSRKDLIEDFAKTTRKVVKELSARGFSSVQINEPSLVYRYGDSAVTSKKLLKAFLASYEEYLSSPGVEVTLHTYFGDCSAILEELVSLEGVSTVGVDFTQTSLDSLDGIEFGEKKLACGCVDGKNSFVESPEWIADYCLEAARVLKPSGLVVLPSCELKYLPRSHADEKARSIGRAAEILRSRVVSDEKLKERGVKF